MKIIDGDFLGWTIAVNGNTKPWNLEMKATILTYCQQILEIIKINKIIFVKEILILTLIYMELELEESFAALTIR